MQKSHRGLGAALAVAIAGCGGSAATPPGDASVDAERTDASADATSGSPADGAADAGTDAGEGSDASPPVCDEDASDPACCCVGDTRATPTCDPQGAAVCPMGFALHHGTDCTCPSGHGACCLLPALDAGDG